MSARRLIGILGVGFVVLLASACSGGGDDERVSELEAQVASLQAQLATAQAEANAAGSHTSTSDATSVTPAPPEAVEPMTDFGFTLAVPTGLEVTTAGVGGNAAASADAGEASASDGQVAVVLVWSTDPATPEEAVAGAFELVRAASTDLDFVPTNQGDLAVSHTDGAFGAFQAERDGIEAGVGIVGGWRCDARVFSLTVLGTDAVAVESAFAGLVGGFGCEA